MTAASTPAVSLSPEQMAEVRGQICQALADRDAARIIAILDAVFPSDANPEATPAGGGSR